MAIKLNSGTPAAPADAINCRWAVSGDNAAAYVTKEDIESLGFSTGGGGGSVAWTDITGKPSTFPPTLPIAESDVTNLVSDLAGKQSSLGYTAENTANKSTSTSLGTSDTLYPSQNAVKTYVDTNVGAANATQIRGKTISSATPLAQELLSYSADSGQYEISYSYPNAWAYYANIANGNFVMAAGFCTPGVVNTNNVSAAAPGADPGMVVFQTTTTATTSGGLTESASTGLQSLSSLLSIRFGIKLVQTTAMRIWFGLSDNGFGGSGSAAAPFTTFRSDTPNANFVGFRYSTAASDTKWMCVTQTDNTHQTATAESTSSHVDTNLHTFEIQFNGTNAVFFIDGRQVGSQSTNLPSTTLAMNVFVAIDNVGAASNKQFQIASIRGIRKG